MPSLRTWREKWSVPRYVYLGEFDHRLLLDLECQEQAEILRMDLQKIKQGKSVVLQEGLPEPRHAWLEGPEGHYMPELVISLALRQPRKALKVDKIATSTISLNTFNQQRLYPPGSEWLYVKLYCAPSLQNDLIAGPIRTFAQEALKRGLAEDWYFLRYADPDPHIRVRFRGNATVLMHQLTPELSRWATQLMMDGPCLKFTFDVYEREIERYGGPGGMLAAEAFFAADSITTAEFLYLLSARIVTLERIVLAVLSIDTLLAQLGLTPVKRLQWCRERAQSRSASGAAYRHYKAQLRALLGAPAALSTLAGGEHIEKIFSSQNVSMIRIAQQLAEAASQQELSQSLTGIYSSFVHMHCNRLLGLKREEEQMAYHLHRRIREGLEKAPLVVQQET
ncbi:hypothetical protein EPA93_45900 [Ktedonosporobacter rubrisoli]|uniref:Thiopeptide-type bacteriocin biosynthesis domain-containing protein n=2 Tax=Ktedonosporobacter rubrisoli TaxID=2509675 RepID=A0A4V0Z0E2_KTERU|nr:hypothetical protein EPA93_45900 [Ktedonosporobacter rubrisoli]